MYQKKQKISLLLIFLQSYLYEKSSFILQKSSKNLGVGMLIFLSILLAGCGKWNSEHGYNYNLVDQERFAKELEVGKSKRQQVVDAFGSPTIDQGQEMCYISLKTTRPPMLSPKIQSYKITCLSFDDLGILQKVNLDNCGNLSYSPYYEKDYIPVGESQQSIAAQVLRNVGRFNK